MKAQSDQSASSAEQMSAWLTEAARELETAHGFLDAYEFPRRAPDGIEYSLAARIARAIGVEHNVASDDQEKP